MKNPIPPTWNITVRPIVEKHKARGGIVLLFGDERHACASYGITKADCRKMRDLLDNIVDGLEDGSLPVWEEGLPPGIKQ